MDQDLRELLSAFNAHKVRYLIVGGYAVGVHAEPRATKDLDLFIAADRENSEAVYRALAAYGAPLTGITPKDFENRPDAGFQIGVAPLRIDILQRIGNVSFEEAWRDRLETIIDGDLPVHVLSRHHLIANKLEYGRYSDLADVEKLREAEED